MVLFPALTSLSVILLIIIFLEGFIHYFFTIHCASLNLTKMIELKSCDRRHRTMRVFLNICNDIALLFLLVLLFVGILLASLGAFITLKIYNEVNILLYILAPVTTLCI